MNFIELVQTVMFLGGYACGRGLGVGNWLSTRLSASAMLRIVDEAARVLSDWPNKYFELLERIRPDHTLHINKTGIGFEFGAFYETLNKTMKSEAYNFLSDAFADYIRTQWDGGFVSRKNRKVDTTSSDRFLTCTKASNLLQVRKSTVEELVDTGQLTAISRRMGTRVLLLLERDSVEQYLRNRQTYLSFTQLCEFLGLSEKPVRALITKGLIGEVEGVSTNKSCPILYRKDEIEALLDPLKLAIPAGEERSKYLSFKQVTRRLSAAGYSVAGVVERILDGKLFIAAVNSDKVGFMQALFSPEEVDAFLQARAIAPSGWQTVPDAARTLGLKQQVVCSLVKSDLLHSCKRNRRGRCVRLVEDVEIQRFRHKYRSAAAIADAAHTSPRSIVQVLANNGVQPVCGPTIDGNRQYFYERHKVRDLKAYIHIASHNERGCHG